MKASDRITTKKFSIGDTKSIAVTTAAMAMDFNHLDISDM
jgi:hypothetical protein